MSTRIAIAGDYYRPAGSVAEVSPGLFHASDLALVNLEGPVTRRRSARHKTGPAVRMDTDALDVLAEAGVLAVAMANNHILDYGLEGLEDTLVACEARGIRHVGASLDADSVDAPLVVDDGGGGIAIYNRGEREWNCEANLGANTRSLFSLARQLRNSAQAGRANIVVLHGGIEYFPLPTPDQVEQLRFLAEAGADAIVMHHTHCFSGMEWWGSCPIYYGVGNFQFVMPSTQDEWYRGLVVDLEVEGPGAVRATTRPVGMDRTTFDVGVLRAQALTEANEAFAERSAIVQDPQALGSQWQALALDSSRRYLQLMTPFPGQGRNAFRARRVLADLATTRMRETQSLWLNSIRCESHRQLLQAVLEQGLSDA